MNTETEFVREKPIPEDKVALVNELAKKMNENRTVLIASCKGLPGEQFHKIKKNLRDKAEIKVAKKSAIARAIINTGKGAMQSLKEQLKADVVLLFSKIDPFELSGILTDSQSPKKAKAGDIAPEDIEIEPGPTELSPGPAISELSGVGLKVAVKDGKLEIQKGAVVVKEGEEIKENVASVLAKLGIEPMKVGFLPLAAYDSIDDKVYVGIVINKEKTLEEMRDLIEKALGFAVNVSYPTKKTIAYFIAKASTEEKALEKLVGVEKSGTKIESSQSEEETNEEKKEENSDSNKDTTEEA